MEIFRKPLLRKDFGCDCSACETTQIDDTCKPFLMRALVAILFLILILLLFCSCDTPSYAYTNEDAIKSIIGEAENQGYKGMVAVACAIRNRGTLKGVYGLKSSRVKNHKYSELTYWSASQAWMASAKIDITNGATGWGNSNDVNEFKKFKWWRKCSIVFNYKDHFFYKEARI